VNFDDDQLPQPPDSGEQAPLATQGPPGRRSPPFAPEPAYLDYESVPEDLSVPWGWLDLLLLALISLAVFLGLAVLLMVSLALVHLSFAEIQTSPRLSGILNVIADAFLFGALIGYLALQMRLRFRAPFWRTVGWRPLETVRFSPGLSYLGLIALGFLLALVVQTGSVLFGTKAKLPIEKLFQDRPTVIFVLGLSVFMAPLVEETIFRGYLYPVVARSFGRGVGVIATGTLFGLLHAAQLWGGWTQIALLVFVGLVLTYVRATRKTVLASYLVHLGYNFTVSFGFLVSTHGLKVLPPGP